MTYAVDSLRARGLASLTTGAIRVYQTQISARTPARCRLSPTCSQYGLEAVTRFGTVDGLRLTYARIRRCNPRHPRTFDPVPTRLSMASSQPRVTREDLQRSGLETVASRAPGLDFEAYDHQFKLILAYPEDREFYSQEEFKRKIAEFNRYVLELEQYAIQLRVDEVQAGKASAHYVLRLSGTMSGEYLQIREDEVVGLLVGQLENFFTVVQAGEFRPVWFEVDGQTLLEPTPTEPVIPASYRRGRDLWALTSAYTYWDAYWDAYVISELAELLADVASAGFQAGAAGFDAVSSGSEVASDGCDLNPFDGDGCDSGCDLNPLDGDGCGFDGCGDGCDPGGCDVDLSGCADGCDLGGCDF